MSRCCTYETVATVCLIWIASSYYQRNKVHLCVPNKSWILENNRVALRRATKVESGVGEGCAFISIQPTPRVFPPICTGAIYIR